MIPTLPAFISIAFAITTLAACALLLVAIRRANSASAKRTAAYVAAGLVLWLVLQAWLALSGFFQDTTSLPPRFLAAVLPPLLLFLALFFTASGKRFLDSLPLAPLTYLNVVRIPVELVLYWLFLNGAVPELMTFAGRNFDILVGLTAPFVAYFGLRRNLLARKAVLAWNLLSLALLLNIVFHGVLSVPYPFQQFAFEQPNIALLYFPFNWLPAVVVPMALFTHLVSIRQLLPATATSGGNNSAAALDSL